MYKPVAYKNGAVNEFRPMQSEKPLPYSVDAERGLLGTLLVNGADVYFDICTQVTAVDFFIGKHRTVYEQLEKMVLAGRYPDPVTVAEALGGTGEDMAYVIGLSNEAVFSLQADSLAEIVREKSIRRRLIQEAGAIASLAFDEATAVNEAVAYSETALLNVQQGAAHGRLREPQQVASDYLARFEQRKEQQGEAVGLPTGFWDLDKVLGGLLPQYYTVAARPGMGKSSFLLNMADYLSAKRNKRGLFFALEMSEAQLMDRRVSNLARVPLSKVKRPWELTADEEARVYGAIGTISESPLVIDDSPILTPSQIRSKCLAAHAAQPLDFVMVDHLHLLRPDTVHSRRDLELADMCNSLRALPKLLDCPVIQAAQLSRNVERQSNKRPSLPDLRDSGGIEETSYAVMFLYRDDYYKPETSERPNITEVIVAKHRDGETGTVDLFWHGKLTSFQNLQRQEMNL